MSWNPLHPFQSGVGVDAMIRSFKDKRTEEIYNGMIPKGIDPSVGRRAQRVLRYLNQARRELDVWAVRGYSSHKLGGERAGQWSLRVNDQWRICYRWTDEGPEDVELTDYH